MSYYEIIEPWEPEVLGVKDGLEQARVFKSGFKNEANYNTFMKAFVNQSFLSADELSVLNFTLECVKLRQGAKLTDFIWFSPKSFCLVSGRVSAILMKHRLAPCKFFPAVLEDSKGKKIEGFNFFYTPSLDAYHIEFSKSKFEVGNKHDGFKEVSIKSPDDLFSVNDFLVVKKVSLTNVSKDLDMFKVKLPIGTLVSEALHREFAAIDVSGIKFRKVEVEINEGS